MNFEGTHVKIAKEQKSKFELYKFIISKAPMSKQQKAKRLSLNYINL